MNVSDLYLVLALLVLAAAAGAAFLRRDLLRPMMAVAGFGAAWGPLSEYWFFRDYWRPRGVFGDPWLEDVLFGAGISALAVGLYPLVTRKRFDGEAFPGARLALLPAFALCYLLAMVVLQVRLGINSILVATLVNLAGAGFVIASRRDLLGPAVVLAALMAVLTAAGYVVGLDLLVDGRAVLAQIWLLYGSPLGVTILGNVPLTEVAWYATWSAMLGIAYPYVSGARLRPGARLAPSA